MKYIGNKARLLGFITDSLKESGVPKSGLFADLFSGTTSVAEHFKKSGYQIVSNDFMEYSFVLQKAYIESNCEPRFDGLMLHIDSAKNLTNVENVINFLNQLNPIRGYCFDNYGSGGVENRMYFTGENAGMIDAIREQIEEWKKYSLINAGEFYYLLALVIEAADHVANMSGTYGAYLKIWRSVALKKLHIKQRDIFDNNLDNRSFKEDSEVLIKELSGDILYLDPPYNSRQYAPNFHVLESIAVWDKQTLFGKSGLRNYDNQKSQFSIKAKATKSLFELIGLAQFEYIALSYNNEGLIKHSELIEFLGSKGKLTIFSTDYRRFRTERNHEKRVYKDFGDRTTEYLFVLKK